MTEKGKAKGGVRQSAYRLPVLIALYAWDIDLPCTDVAAKVAPQQRLLPWLLRHHGTTIRHPLAPENLQARAESVRSLSLTCGCTFFYHRFFGRLSCLDFDSRSYGRIRVLGLGEKYSDAVQQRRYAIMTLSDGSI